ncbi:SH3 domain-containing protein [Helicobacter sp. 11S02629-2]|uniref:SH3 domain-containing protein n=1 Tax=Helicobacter sp. 11S02629-2 TaxID=1476195 RepID=UPI000BA663DC|nr:SH3 domain-containing protein [Helicobacter sp. 11S02629-2]PAF45971.1 hypothetical protein BKH40_00740 [Helicobacter sp. 11S02629-2]
MKKISTLFKIYTLPLAVVVIGLIIYWAIVTTIGKPDQVRTVMSKKSLSKEEEQLVMMQNSASETFIKDTLSKNLSKIEQRGSATITSNEDGITTVATPVVIESISPRASQILNKAVNNVKITQQESNIAREIEFNIPARKRGSILANAAFIREEPSTKSKVLTRVLKDEKVIILDSKDGFYRVRFKEHIGYIAKALVATETPKKENPIELTLNPSNHADIKNRNDIDKILSINTKTEAKKDSNLQDAQASIDTSKDISNDINSTQSTSDKESSTKEANSEDAKNEEAKNEEAKTNLGEPNITGIVIVDAAIIRQEPSVQSSIIGKIERNKHFLVLEDKYTHFYKIRYGEIVGYVAKRLVDVEHTEPKNTQDVSDVNLQKDDEAGLVDTTALDSTTLDTLEPAKSDKAIVLAHKANVRLEPNEEARIVAKSPQGREVNVLGVKDGWALIEYKFKGRHDILNIKGYILERLLKYE